MSLKNKIKNDLWQVNYIVPFVKKDLAKYNKVKVLRNVLKAYHDIHPVRSSEGKRCVARDTKKLLEDVDISIDSRSNFIYFIDTGKTVAVKGNIISNFSLDYNKVVNSGFNRFAEEAQKN